MLKVLKDSKIFLNILKNLNILEVSLVSHKPNHSLEFYGISKDVNINMSNKMIGEIGSVKYYHSIIGKE